MIYILQRRRGLAVGRPFVTGEGLFGSLSAGFCFYSDLLWRYGGYFNGFMGFGNMGPFARCRSRALLLAPYCDGVLDSAGSGGFQTTVIPSIKFHYPKRRSVRRSSVIGLPGRGL